MRTEVHVHGSIFLCKGVRPSQIDQAMRPWLGYLDVDTIADAHSLEREEPGINYDPKERVVNICWTGEVGRSFQSRLTEAFHNLGPLTEYASELRITLKAATMSSTSSSSVPAPKPFTSSAGNASWRT
jgi:hypothetical protein